METIVSAMRDALAGRPIVVFITGEPGVGKTRLLTEAAARARAELDANVLYGFALETSGAPAYFPLYRTLQGAVSQLIRSEPSIARQVSVLAAAGIINAPSINALTSLSPEAERLRLYDAFAEVSLRLAEKQPLLLALDDLQWADTGTWDALAYLMRSANAASLSVIVACRDEVLLPGGTGSKALAELNRQRLLLHLPLKRLAPEAVRLLGQDYLGGPLTDSLAATLNKSSEGNPFFAEEVLRGISLQLVRDWSGAYYLSGDNDVTTETALPTLKLTVMRRLEVLPPETQEVLKAAAVVGRNFSSRLVAEMLAQPIEEVESRLTPALAATVISGAKGDYSFAHDTLREAAYDLAGSDRRQLHKAAAHALSKEARRNFETLSSLAHHWLEADVPLAAAKVCSDAGEMAGKAKAYTEALDYARKAAKSYERALGDNDSQELLQAHLALAEAALICGEYTEAEQTLLKALNSAQRRGDAQLEGQICKRLGVLFRRRERAEESSAFFRKALDLLRGDAAKQELVEILIELANLEGMTRARYKEAEEFGEKAIVIADELGVPLLKANAALAMAGVRSRSIDPTAGRPLLLEALELAAGHDPFIAAEACAALSNSYYWTGEMHKAYEYARRRLDLAEKGGDVFGMRHAHSWLAIVLTAFGRWQEARDLLNHCEPLLARLDNPEPIAFVRVLRSLIAYQLGDYEESYRNASDAIQMFERVDPATVVWYLGVLILAALATGRREEAERHIRLQEARLREMPESALPARSARTVLGLAYVLLGDKERAVDCEHALRPYANDQHWWLTRRTLAELAALRGDHATAVQDVTTAETLARREGLLPDLALILYKKAELLGRSTAEGEAALSEARRLLESLNMKGALARTELPSPAQAQAPAGLTPREVEVLRLLAQGKTNREIADLLFISEHTVINHISHIFAKIGVDNRTSAAAFAHLHGLN
jgi:predicted ATPase/DNA-binding CsgD family transcriptional regulator